MALGLYGHKVSLFLNFKREDQVNFVCRTLNELYEQLEEYVLDLGIYADGLTYYIDENSYVFIYKEGKGQETWAFKTELNEHLAVPEFHYFKRGEFEEIVEIFLDYIVDHKAEKPLGTLHQKREEANARRTRFLV